MNYKRIAGAGTGTGTGTNANALFYITGHLKCLYTFMIHLL